MAAEQIVLAASSESFELGGDEARGIDQPDVEEAVVEPFPPSGGKSTGVVPTVANEDHPDQPSLSVDLDIQMG